MTGPRIVAGYIRRAHGIRGEVIVRSLSDDPDRFAVGKILMTDEDPPRSFEIRSSRSHGDGELLQFDGISDRTTAETLRGISLTIDPTERRSLDEDEFWPDQLVGLEATTRDGRSLGRVVDVILGAAQDRLVVASSDGDRCEVPFVSAIVVTIDLEGGTAVIDPPEGLIPG